MQVALKRAAEARGVSARLAQALEAERRRVRCGREEEGTGKEGKGAGCACEV